MIGADLTRQLAGVLDAHVWDQLPGLLHASFRCYYVHTGETFDADAWVRLNVGYPGFERFVLQDLVGDGDRAVGRAHVTATMDGVRQHFEVASFLTSRDGLIIELVEVWTDIAQATPGGTRPQV